MKKLIQAIKEKWKPFKERHTTSKVSMVKDYIFAGLKIIFGIGVGSYFFIISGLYSISIGLAKTSFFNGRAINESLEGQAEQVAANEYKHLAKMAAFILAGSITYVFYMARLFFVKPLLSYGEIPAITIAAISFAELSLAVINLKKSKGALNTGLRCVNLTSALTAIVLTQVALLSFAHYADASFYNALSGTIFGGLCVVVALVMFFHYFAYRRKTAKAAEIKSEDRIHDGQE